MSDAVAERIVRAWGELEDALRGALPVCSVAPPTQPSELVAALRVSGILGPEDEAHIAELRKVRLRAAFGGEEFPEVEAARYEEAVRSLVERVRPRRGCR